MMQATISDESHIVTNDWTVRKVQKNVVNVYLRIGEQKFKEVHAAAHSSIAGTAKIIDITSDGDVVDTFFGEENLAQLRAKLCKSANMNAYAIFVVPSFTDIP